MRAGIVAHGVTLGVLLLFLGLIHVAPLGATPKTPSVIYKEPQRGYLRVDAHPWARIYVDDKLAGVTPLGKPLELGQGPHAIRFEHDYYMPIVRSVDITPSKIENATPLVIDFERQSTLKPGMTKPKESP